MIYAILVNYAKRLINLRLLLSILLIINALIIISPVLNAYTIYVDWRSNGFVAWLNSLGFLKLLDIPRFILGISLVLQAFFMLTGSRVAWVFTLFWLATISCIDLVLTHEYQLNGCFSLALFIAFSASHKYYTRQSLTSTGFIAVMSMLLLLVYSIFGTLYLGEEFKPMITDIPTALYFALISITTVGYGDIVPISASARLFALTLILFGITIFTTSVVYVMHILVKGTQNIVRKRLSFMNHHYVIIGNNAFAKNLYLGVKKRNLPVTVICCGGHPFDTSSPATLNDLIIEGDPTDTNILNAANVKNAKSILIVSDDDACNLFTVLGLKGITNVKAQITIMVNQDENMVKVRRLQPDMIFSLSSLSSEIVLKLLCDEEISTQTVTNLLLDKIVIPAKDSAD